MCASPDSYHAFMFMHDEEGNQMFDKNGFGKYYINIAELLEEKDEKNDSENRDSAEGSE